MRKIIASCILLICIADSYAQKSSLNEKIYEITDLNSSQYFKIYTDLHKNPELSLMEFKTAKKMAETD